jgi:sec-independent protein translocase protein TatB
MFDVGFSEILLTSAIALVVLGPERLPKVARQVGNWMGRARTMARQLSEQLEREVNAEELLKSQSKTVSSGHLPGGRPTTPPSGGTLDSDTQPPATAAPAAAPPQAIDAIPPAPSEPEPVFGGLPPAATTPAAMHASDPHVADSKSTHE